MLIKCYSETNTGKMLGTVHSLFIDFQAANDTVWRKGIRSEMPKPPTPKKIVHCAEF
jgi:hypothetical protein